MGADAPQAGPEPVGAGADPAALLVSRRFLALLALATIVGVAVSVAAWCLLELLHGAQTWVYDDLPGAFGFDAAPAWWPLPALALAGLLVAAAIRRLPGGGGHVPAEGLSTGVVAPRELPGVLAAATASIALGAVVGPEAPLIALGGGLGLALIRLIRRDAPDEAALVIAAAGTFAALTMIFSSPLIAAVILIEAAGLDGRRLPVVLVPGLLAASVGSLISVGLGAWSGLSDADYAIGALALPELARPTFLDLVWTLPFAAAVALGAVAVVRLGRRAHALVAPRLWGALPLAGLAVGAIAMLFDAATGRGVGAVLFSGQELLDPLTSGGGSWPDGDLALLIACKGAAWAICLGAFRGGPVFPALLLGAAAGLLAADLPGGYDATAAVAVGMGAAAVAVLRLPLASAVLATLLTARAGVGAAPLVIAGVLAAYLTALAVDRPRRAARAPAAAAPRAPAVPRADAAGPV